MEFPLDFRRTTPAGSGYRDAMLFDAPDDDTLYDALLARDPRFDGRAWVAVTSTGIFCRLTCTARKPKRENCRFFDRAVACLEAGFRPCKRCHPLLAEAPADAAIRDLVAALEAEPGRRWSEAEIVSRGLDPSTLRRVFRQRYGVTFLEMARLMRVRAGFEAIGAGETVLEAGLDAGFSSASGFREAFARLLGSAPGALSGTALLTADMFDTPVGPMIAVADARALHLLEFLDRKALPGEMRRLSGHAKGSIGIGRTAPLDQIERELEAYFAGRSATFTVPLVFHGTPFEQTVWRALVDIPAGRTVSYGDLARTIGRPTATRAVARANGANQIAIVVPCHRVIGADGTLTGYGGGLWRKHRLIEIERAFASAPDQGTR